MVSNSKLSNWTLANSKPINSKPKVLLQYVHLWIWALPSSVTYLFFLLKRLSLNLVYCKYESTFTDVSVLFFYCLILHTFAFKEISWRFLQCDLWNIKKTSGGFPFEIKSLRKCVGRGGGGQKAGWKTNLRELSKILKTICKKIGKHCRQNKYNIILYFVSIVHK